MLSACGNNTSDVSDAQIDDMVESDVEEMDEEDIDDENEPEEELDEVEDEQEAEPAEENNLPEPTFIKKGRSVYTVIINCPDNSNAPELQTAKGYSCVANSDLTAGVSSSLAAAVIAVGVINGNDSKISFDAYKDYVFPTYDFAFKMQTPFVFTDNPELYDDATAIISRDSYEKFDEGYQYTVPLMIQESCSATNCNLTCLLARMYEGPAKWEQMIQDCSTTINLSIDEIYANYDARLVYETLGLEYPGFAEKVISMISPDEKVYAARIYDDGSYDQVSYIIERTE